MCVAIFRLFSLQNMNYDKSRKRKRPSPTNVTTISVNGRTSLSNPQCLIKYVIKMQFFANDKFNFLAFDSCNNQRHAV